MELALGLSRQLNTILFIVFFIISFIFVYRSFYSMRIDN
jgi:hypothetical protein